MSDLTKSLEKSVAFLKERYPDDLPLLLSLQNKLKRLQAKEKKAAASQVPSGRADAE